LTINTAFGIIDTWLRLKRDGPSGIYLRRNEWDIATAVSKASTALKVSIVQDIVPAVELR